MSRLLDKYGSWAVITGANSGIGQEFAKLLAKEGFNLVLVARRQPLLDELANTLRAEANIEVRPVALDLLEPYAVQTLAKGVADLDVGLVIPCAGVDEMGRFVEKDYASIDKMLDLNVKSPTELTHVFAKKMEGRKHSGIILVSSLFGYQGIPNFAAYAASKSYILILGESLNVELKSKGIDLTVLSPGLTDTPFSQNMAIDFSQLPMIAQKPADVARCGLNSLGKKSSNVSGILNKFYAWENRLLPRWAPVKLFGFLIDRAIAVHGRRAAKSGAAAKAN